MSVTFYDQPSLKGKYLKLTDDCPDLTKHAFSNMTRSLQIDGDPWVMFSQANYKGNFRIYKHGNYFNLGDFAEEIASTRQIKGSLDNPEIHLFEDINYQGKSRSITGATDDVKPAGLGGQVSAHEVKRGAWILYTDTRLHGQRMFTMDDQPNYYAFGWNDKLCSLEPVTEHHLEKP